MKRWTLLLSFLLFTCLVACVKDPAPQNEVEETAPVVQTKLASTSIDLGALSSFKTPGANWQIVGSTFSDPAQNQHLEADDGTGVLVNLPTEEARSNLFSNFEHGDIELEIEVMVPKGSNSGIYLQSRYEVQVFDSWGVKEARHSDMGGIYQRWDPNKPEGQEGYEGVAPAMNAAKAPGLWQHYKIIFHAPRFDANGQKIQNASFEEVWLNGVLIHENVSLSGPTRAAAHEDEVAQAALMIQGDHGPVAYRNIQYKLYNNPAVSLANMSMKEFANDKDTIPDFSLLTPKREITTDTFSYNMGSTRENFCLFFEGELNAPESGDYIFSTQVNRSGVVLIIGQDTLFDLAEDTPFEESFYSKVNLQKGNTPFKLVFNKPKRWWARGFLVHVEGPGIQKHALHAPSSAFTGNQAKPIVLADEETALMQRGFMMYNGEKLTHTVAVSTPQRINYAFNLALGSLIQVWGGDFLDVTDMWHQRGNAQLGTPLGPVIEFLGQPDFSTLKKDDAPWPNDESLAESFRQIGYELDENDLPTFISELEGVTIKNKLIPDDQERRLSRQIEVDGSETIWLRIDQGSKIEKLPNGHYAVNDYNYYVIPSKELESKIQIRKTENVSELIVRLDKDLRTISYDLVW